MHLDRFVAAAQRDLAAAVPEDSAAAEHAERLALALDSSLRLHLLGALSEAADELSAELAPGSVSLTLSGGEPRLTPTGLTTTGSPAAEAGTLGPTEHGAKAATGPATHAPDSEPLTAAASLAEQALSAALAVAAPFMAEAGDSGETARINLRLPESLKSRAEEAAAAAGLSVNAWLVRTVAAAVTVPPVAPTPPASSGRGDQRHVTGWMH